MKAICFYFQIHQPFRLKTYRFFNIGNDHYYYDDFANDEIITRIAHRSYLPANQTLLEMINASNKQFKVAFSISGTALEQLEQYVPEFIESMKELVATGCVEFLSETYAHSLASLKETEEFIEQVKQHDEKIFQLFGQRPTVFRNTELIYSDDISAVVASMGFKAAIVSPELNRELMLSLPRLSALPLGYVLKGSWPVGISRFGALGVRLNEPFASPKGELFWARQYGQNVWLYPGWEMDLTEKRPELEKAGYSFSVTLQERPPQSLPRQPRPGLFNWENPLL